MLFPKKICLALGGGGARGICHLGVLKVLEENNLIPDMIVGTSIGAFVGAAYAMQKYSIKELILRFQHILESDEFKDLKFPVLDQNKGNKPPGIVTKIKESVSKINFFRKLESQKYIIDHQRYEKVLKLILPNIKMEELPIKFAVVALDMRTRKEIVLSHGPLIKAVMASSSIPGVFQPVVVDDTLLIDGGWIELIPVVAAYKLKADKTIAVDIRSDHDLLKSKNGFELMNDAGKIITDNFVDLQLKQADLILKVTVNNEWYNFTHFEQLVRIGEKVAQENLLQLKKLFKYKRGVFGFGRMG